MHTSTFGRGVMLSAWPNAGMSPPRSADCQSRHHGIGNRESSELNNLDDKDGKMDKEVAHWRL